MPNATVVRKSIVQEPAINDKNLPTLESLKQSVQGEKQRRSMIKDFVTSQLKEGVDYGTISIGGREAKPTLFKPGMEKIFSLFQIVSQLQKDEETLSMITTRDIIAYKCELYRNNQFIGEGRGACSISEKGRINDAIKIAEKRARMDACLNLGFSEYFTQDLEDIKDEEQSTPPRAPMRTSYSERPTNETLEFTVLDKEELTSASGSPYAKINTDKGTVIAFKNTMDKFERSGTYVSGGTWEERNGNTAFVITVPASHVLREKAPKA